MELEQKQTMQLVMTQELQQAIGLLQMSSYELSQFIREQADENPFIEFLEEYQEEPVHTSGSVSNPNQSYSTSSPLETVSAENKSMHDQLLEQIMLLPLDEEEKMMLRYLILNIDERGFLRLTDEEIVTAFSLTEEQTLKLRDKLRALEPCGLGARNLRECLLWQAERFFPDDIILHTVIREHLQSLADKQWQQIGKDLNVTLETVKEAHDNLQLLNPRPASNFIADTTYITPDLTVEWKEEQSTYSVILHDHYIPNFSFNRSYAEKLPDSKENSRYITNRFRQFEWLEQSIMKRRETIIKIMHVLLRYQEEFFDKGLRALKPLTMKDVADEIEMHESTISRATANKIIETPAGIFELRQLFTSKLQTADGEGTSQMTVKEIIREMVIKEDKTKPLSDQRIVHLLAEKEIIISRRTVAKYRDAMGILSSSKRKEISV